MKKQADPKPIEKKVKKTEIAKPGLALSILDLDGKQKEKIPLSAKIFSAEINKPLLSQYVRVYLTNQRQGSAKAKTRGEIRGSTKKIYRQKGTGRARHGAKSAPIFVGGGVAFPPLTKNYSLKLNKKQKRIALFSALSLLQKEGNLTGLTDKSLQIEAKTKVFADLLKNSGFLGQKILLVLPKLEKNNLVLAARNIDGVSVRDAKSLNTYDLLNSQKVIFLKDALKVLEEHFLKTRQTS